MCVCVWARATPPPTYSRVDDGQQQQRDFGGVARTRVRGLQQLCARTVAGCVFVGVNAMWVRAFVKHGMERPPPPLLRNTCYAVP